MTKKEVDKEVDELLKKAELLNDQTQMMLQSAEFLWQESVRMAKELDSCPTMDRELLSQKAMALMGRINFEEKTILESMDETNNVIKRLRDLDDIIRNNLYS